jgi:hypothetical protein
MRFLTAIASRCTSSSVSKDFFPSGHKQIIARFIHAQKRSSDLLKATKNIPKIPDLKGIGISQDLTKNRSNISYLTATVYTHQGICGNPNGIPCCERRAGEGDRTTNIPCTIFR